MATTAHRRNPGSPSAPAELRATSYAVVDVETTGLEPATDRIVELAIVRLDADGQLTGAYATLVCPDGPLNGTTAIHGIWADQAAVAPPFAQVAGAVAARLKGAVIVGHKVAFDLGFLYAAFARAGVGMPPWPAICTMRLTERLGLRPPGGRSLGACCEAAGVELDPEQAHTALADARATAELFAGYLELARAPGGIGDTLAALGCEPVTPAPWRWRIGLGYRSRQHRRSRPHEEG